MILWTIRTEAAWHELVSHGVLRGSRDRVMECSWGGSYRWMVAQMKRRVGHPPSPQAFPIWAWAQYEGEARPRPDLRCGGHLPKGEVGVRIEFECPEDHVLLSDFELWHYVLNYWNLPRTADEGERFEGELKGLGLSFFRTKPLPNLAYHRHIVRSWDRIFELDWSEHDLANPRSRKSIQATVWELRIGQVMDERHFTAR